MAPTPRRRKPAPTDFRFDAGRLVLDFVGTVGHRPTDHVERLSTPERLRDWSVAAGLPPLTTAPSASDLARAVELREAVCELLEHTVEPVADGEVSQEALATVNALAAAPPPVPSVHRAPDADRPQPLVVRHDEPVDVDALLGVLARDLTALLADETLGSRLRRCEAGACRKIFLDTAPRPRRWCSRQYCGTRTRVAAHRARTAPS